MIHIRILNNQPFSIYYVITTINVILCASLYSLE